MYLTLPVSSATLKRTFPALTRRFATQKHHESGLSQIAIFTLDTVKITKRFACVNEKRTQQTGALLTELTRRWSNLGSGSHGQLFRPYWGSSTWHSLQSMNGENQSIKDPLARPPTPPPTFQKAPPPLLFRHITQSSFSMGINRIP